MPARLATWPGRLLALECAASPYVPCGLWRGKGVCCCACWCSAALREKCGLAYMLGAWSCVQHTIHLPCPCDVI